MNLRRQLRLLLALALAWACGGDRALGPTTFDVSGDWYWEEALQDANIAVFCFDSGGVSVTQNGPHYTATGAVSGYCSGPGGSSSFTGEAFSVSDGTIDGTITRFHVDPCPYQGTMIGTIPDSVTGTVSCTLNVPGGRVRLSGTWRLLRERPDNSPPQLFGSISGNTFSLVFFLVGDTLRISVSAHDDRGLRYVGYRLSGAMTGGDSIATTDTVLAHVFTIPITALMAGTSTITYFARDRQHEQTAPFTPDTIRAAAVRGRRARAVALPSAVRDAVYDAKRARVYLAMTSAPQIAVLDPAAGVVDSLIPLPGRAGGVDLSLSGDSLLVALEDRGSFATVSLLSGAVDTVHIEFDTTLLHEPSFLRMTADGKVFVTGTQRGISGFAGQLMAIDLATGTQRQRTDVGVTVDTTSGIIDTYAPLIRAGDRSRLFLLQMGACCPVQGWVYVSGSTLFSAPTGIFVFSTGSMTASQTGGKLLIGNRLFNGDLAAPDTVRDPDYTFGPTTLSADGTRAYLVTTFGSWPGLVIRRTTDDALLEQAFVPNWGQENDRLLLLPDGFTLLAYTGTGYTTPQATTLYIVDLH
jgi:hypothetical protein